MINKKLGLKGEYRYEIRRNGELYKESDWFDNVILLTGLDRLGGTTISAVASPVLRFSRIGTGTSVPVNTQTQLDAQAAFSNAGSTAIVVNSGSPDYETTHTFSFAYTQGAVVGNMSEIATGWDTTGSTLFSRALILDGFGSPTTITLTAIDQLTVFYRLTLVPDLADSTGSINIGATSHNYTLRPRNVGSFGNSVFMFSSPQSSNTVVFNPIGIPNTCAAATSLSAITTSPATSGTGGSRTIGVYSTSSYFRDDTFDWSITQGNATGGVGIFLLGWGGGSPNGTMAYQMQVTPAVPKDNTRTMSITARFSWAAV
jgi:hypothetical protein